ncbi:MAG TPA: hypothetical protein VHI77_00455 [Solirubrobacterales bacterium]|nr:hypothetical protein [Solirubrobacterales bacterium]
MPEIRRPTVRPHAGLLAVAVALALTLAAPSTALARCHSGSKTTTYDIALHGTHGYRLEFESDAAGRVVLWAERKDRLARYTVGGTIEPHGLKASFGALGGLALHVRHPRRDPFPAEPVLLEGHLVFHGEEGFTSISRRRVRGAVFRRSAADCGRRAAAMTRLAEASDRSSATLVVAAERSSTHSVSVELQASDPPDLEENGGGDFADARLQERREGMRIERAVVLDGPVTASVGAPLGTDPLTGEIFPPPPYHGTATYSGGPGSPAHWDGDLSVSFPGASNVPLTGPGFSALACRGAGFRAVDRCREEIVEFLQQSFLFPL